MKRYEITKHYKDFFDLHAKGIALNEDDHLTLDWAEDLVKNCIIPDVRCSALFDAMGSFAVKTFPDAGSIEHLKKLKHEADEAIAEPQSVEEYADMLLALFGAAEKAGITHKQLIEASEGKLEVVKTRTWKKLPDGTYQHCT